LEIIKSYEGAVQNFFPLQLNVTEQNALVMWLKQETKSKKFWKIRRWGYDDFIDGNMVLK